MFKRGKERGSQAEILENLEFPKYIKDHLQESWAGDFFQNVFLHINEDRFSVLYSKCPSGPNKDVRILVGLMLLKELNGLSDEELFEDFYCDTRYHYALGITDFKKQKVCINTITNFRSRLIKYETEVGIDLWKEEVSHISQHIAEYMGIDLSKARMDSMMVNSSCKGLSRYALVYNVIKNVIKDIKRLDPLLIPNEFKCFLEKGHKNKALRHEQSGIPWFNLKCLITSAAELQNYIHKKGIDPELTSVKHLSRMLKEQSITAENGEILVIDGSNVAADSLQNPSDPDATYRQKAGKGYTGYVLNTAEVRDVNRNVGIIMSHDYQKNIYSDAKFGRTFMEKDPLTEHLKQLSVDGAYFSSEMSQEAGEKGIELNLSNLTGRKVLKDVIGVEQFKRDTDTGVIIKCPAGHTPCESKRVEYKQEYHAKFLKKHCNNCPLKSKCQVKELKKYYSIKFSEKKLQIDQHRSRQGSKRHQELSSFRAGVEGIPSTLRRRYKIDSMPVRGYLRTKIWVNSKVAAYNIQMLLRYTGMAIQAA